MPSFIATERKSYEEVITYKLKKLVLFLYIPKQRLSIEIDVVWFFLKIETNVVTSLSKIKL